MIPEWHIVAIQKLWRHRLTPLQVFIRRMGRQTTVPLKAGSWRQLRVSIIRHLRVDTLLGF